MGIINRNRPDGGQGAGTTVIAPGTKLVGDLTLSDNLHVDGHLEGTVHCEAEVAIGEKGRIEGDLDAEQVLISGQFEGRIDARRLEIVAGGRVDGDVAVAQLVIEPGAHFNGNSRTRETDESASRHKPAKSTESVSGQARREGDQPAGKSRETGPAKAG